MPKYYTTVQVKLQIFFAFFLIKMGNLADFHKNWAWIESMPGFF